MAMVVGFGERKYSATVGKRQSGLVPSTDCCLIRASENLIVYNKSGFL